MNLIEKQNKTQIMFPPEIRDYLGIKYLVKHEFKTKISLTKQYKTPSSQHNSLKKITIIGEEGGGGREEGKKCQ